MALASKLSAHDYEQKLRSLTTELLLTEERERKKIASDLHDNIGQSLALIKMRLIHLLDALKNNDLSKELRQVVDQISKVIDDSRTLVFEISPPVLYRFGLIPAVQWLVEQFEVEHKISIDLSVEEATGHPEESVSVFLFRAIKELLFNIAKHADTRKAKIKICFYSDQIKIIVEDAGRGINAVDLDNKTRKKKTYGLFCIEERLKYIGGKFSVFSNPGEGTRVEIAAPLKTEDGAVDGIKYEEQY